MKPTKSKFAEPLIDVKHEELIKKYTATIEEIAKTNKISWKEAKFIWFWHESMHLIHRPNK